MLALTLQKLQNSNRPDDLDVRIFADNSADLESVEYVRDLYYPEALIFQAKPHIEAPSGCWNILNSIKQGYETGAEHIILLEEDVLVRPGFFEWHLNPSNRQYLASCGRKDRHHYPIYGPLYTNPGSCLRHELVEQLVPHINDDYFTRLREYLDEHFEPWDTQSILDDGLIRRVIRKMGGQAVYPEKPVCAHIGWRFYGKLDLYQNNEVGIENRITRLRQLMQSIKPGDRYASDFEFY
jgi:hypothetical protein